MKRLAFLLSFLLFCSPSWGTTVSRYQDYETNDTLTADNLNGNFDNIVNVLNGGLDNDNVDTDSVRFIDIVSALPANGNQGRVVYETGTNLLYFEDGSNWFGTVIVQGTPTAGDTIRYNGSEWVHAAHGVAPVGTIVMWPTDTAPDGWLLCNGQEVGRTAYSTLFALVGTTYGAGNGTTSFNVPDLRGRFPLGQDDMGGSSANRVTDTDADTLGGNDGDEFVTLTTSNIPAHSHNINVRDNTGTSAEAASSAGTGGTVNSAATASDGGSGGAHDNMPPFLTLNFIIKAVL